MKDYNGDDEVFQTGKKILLFTAKWCPDCIALKLVLDEIVCENKQWEFIVIDTDKYIDIAKKFNIIGIPSFVGLKDGEIIGELISKDRKSKNLINSWIKTLGVIKYDR